MSPAAPVAFFCQICKARLLISGHEKAGGLPAAAGAGAAVGHPPHGARIDESFIVLDDRGGGGGGRGEWAYTHANVRACMRAGTCMHGSLRVRTRVTHACMQPKEVQRATV